MLFESDHLSKDLAGKSVRGGMTTMGSQGIRFILQIASTAILARLLTPADFGLIGMVTIVVNFATMFKDAGLSMATVQKDEISHELISTLFWINVLISVALGLCVLVCAPLVSWFYGKPELTAITAVLSLSFIISGLGIQHTALLRRHMRFGRLAIIQIVAQCIMLAVTILLALNGWSYWALVGGSLATAISTVLMTLFLCPWIPGRMQKGTGMRNMLKFGGHLTGFEFINYFSRNADNILIGRFIGIDALGLYSKAYQIVYMPLTNIRNPINAVVIPVLSSLKNEPERFRRYYGKIVFVMAIISMPLMAFCVLFSEELILLIFGAQWLAMTDLFRLLAIAGFIQPVTGTRGALLIACGQSKVYLALGAITAILSVTGFCIGIIWGVIGVATSIVIVIYAQQYPLFSIAFRYVPGSFRELLGNCWHVAMISWFSAVCSKVLVMGIPGLKNLSLLWGSLTTVIILSGLFLLIPAIRKNFQESMAILKKGITSR
jgi:O-antigen/teichoic acid export membrane protein